MRLRVEVTTSASELPWPSVLAPGRAVAYSLLASAAPELGRLLHESGWGPHGMVPFGHSAPVFPGARRTAGRYAAGGSGVVEFGSPLPSVVEAWAKELGQRELLDWGGVAFRVTNVTVVDPPEFAEGAARLRTATPVVLNSATKDDEGNRPAKPKWLLPLDDGFADCLRRNLVRKAETFGLSSTVDVEAITWVGPKRSFVVGKGAKPGAAVEVELRGEPQALKAFWSWGLGQANAAGFGWVAA